MDQRIIAAAVALNSVQFGKTRTFEIRVKFGSNLTEQFSKFGEIYAKPLR
ncbi:hypothetical protein [Campylobacter rectus]|nr:hypothetical protein [Campylobacter rectus]